MLAGMPANNGGGGPAGAYDDGGAAGGRWCGRRPQAGQLVKIGTAMDGVAEAADGMKTAIKAGYPDILKIDCRLMKGGDSALMGR